MFKLFKKQPEESERGPEENAASTVESSQECGSEAGNTDAETASASEGESQNPEETSEEKLINEFGGWLDENLSDESIRQAAIESMRTVISALRGEQAEEALYELIAKGAGYDRAVAEAEAAGELKGRNAKIIEERELQMEGDGVPHPGSGGNVYDAPSPSIFEVARGAW